VTRTRLLVPVAAGPLVAGLVVGAYAAALRRYGIFDPVDEGLLLLQAARVAAGQAPYVDFHTGYGPLYFRLQAILVSAGGLDAVRWALVGVHATAGALLYALTRRLGGATLAAVAVALEIAFFLPLAPAQGAPLNAPYPGWYAGLAGVAIAVLMSGEPGAIPPLRAGLAGVVAGIVFAIKPNSGLLLAAGAAAAVVLAGGAEAGRRTVRLAALALFLAAALFLVLPTGLTIAAFVLVAPVAGLLALGVEQGTSDRAAVPALVALAAGFVASAAAAFANTLGAIGVSGFARHVLLIGAGVAELYAVPLPWTAGVAASVGVVAFVLRGRHARALLAAAGIAVVLGLFSGGADAPSAAAGLRRGTEAAAFALLPLALWGALTVVRRGHGGGLAPVTAVTVAAVLQAYPRPDFVHLMPLGVLVLPLALRVWQAGVAQVLPAGAAGAVGVAAPLVLAAGRFLPTLAVLGRLATGGLLEVPLGQTTLLIAPAGAPALRALAATAEVIGRTASDDPVLSFPACGFPLFLAGRLPAGPHDYFYPGRPDRAEVQALTMRWAANPPRLAVTCRADGTPLSAAWDAYPELVRFLEAGYREVASQPPYAVQERR
jgi:hypothetical protein